MVKTEISKRRIKLLGVVTTILFKLNTSAFAGSALWDSAPASGDWNTAGNWTPDTVPNGSTDTATFGTSTQTAISLSANTGVDGIVFNSGANAFTISAPPGDVLTISGAGIANNSAVFQNFVSSWDGAGNFGTIRFTNDATAGVHTTFTTNGGGVFGADVPAGVEFFNNSSAAAASFTNNGVATNGILGGETSFYDNSTASTATFTNNGGMISGGSYGFTIFLNSSTAANAVFINNPGTSDNAYGGFTYFAGTSTGGNGNFINNGASVSGVGTGGTFFSDSASATNGTFTNNGGTGAGAGGGSVSFFTTATASNSTVMNHGGTVTGAFGGFTAFYDTSSAEEAIVTANGATVAGAFGGDIRFFDSSTAGNATLIANAGTNGGSGGQIFFFDHSTGGTARVQVFGNGFLDVSGFRGFDFVSPLIIGSLEGTGNVFLGEYDPGYDFAIGSNNLNTVFSGVIQDGGVYGGTGGSLTKIGTGTLTLSGANTYTGATIVEDGRLIVNGSITSAVTVNGGSLGGSGTVRTVTINSGGTLSPGNSPGILNVAGDLTLTMGATYLVDLNGKAVGTQYDQTNVIGAVSLGDSTLDQSWLHAQHQRQVHDHQQ